MTDINVTRSARDVVHSKRYKFKALDEPFKIADVMEMVIISVVTVVFVFTFLFRIVGVVGTSMQPTLHEEDRLILSNLFYEPKYKDIVVVSSPEHFDEPIIKRVIATPGQVIDIDFRTGTVTVDGVVLQEEYINERTSKPGTVTFPMTLGEDEYFVMGDNRNHSEDSRRIGCVSREEIMGRVLLRIYPADRFGKAK